MLLIVRPLSSEAQLVRIFDDNGMKITRSIENLKDLDYQTWQLLALPQLGGKYPLVLRIVGFTGSLRLNHPTSLEIKSGIKEWSLDDITLENSELVNDNRDAAAEFDLSPLLKDLQNNRPLRMTLRGGFSELPIPPYVVKEWRSIDFDDEN